MCIAIAIGNNALPAKVAGFTRLIDAREYFVSDHVRIPFRHTRPEGIHQQLFVRKVAGTRDARFVARRSQQLPTRALSDQQPFHRARRRHDAHGRLSRPVLHGRGSVDFFTFHNLLFILFPQSRRETNVIAVCVCAGIFRRMALQGHNVQFFAGHRHRVHTHRSGIVYRILDTTLVQVRNIIELNFKRVH